MFCSRCGNVIDDSSNYCKHCGVPLNDDRIPGIKQIDCGNTTLNPILPISVNNSKLFLLLAIIGATFLIMIGGILPLISIKKISHTESYNIFQYWEEIKTLSRWGMDSDTIKGFRILLMIPSAAFILSTILGIKFFADFVSGVRGQQLTLFSTASTGCGILGIGLLTLYRYAINYRIEEELYEIIVLSGTNMVWVLLTVELINLLILIPGYLGNRIFGVLTRSEQIENDRITSEKICLICKTKYTLGERCPKCGSEAVSKE